MPVPESSGWAGHPLFAHSAAISATIFGSVTRRASPATITSKPFVATLIVQRGSRATFFALRVRSPVWNQQEPACQSAPTLVTCGLPSAFRVVSQNVDRFGERGSSCIRRSASCASTWDHWIVGSPSASPRFIVSMVLENSFFDRRRRSLVVRLRAELNGLWPTRSGGVGAAPREDADDKRPELRHERAATIQDAREDHVRLDELD